MKNDILTIAVVVFFVGVLVSSVGFSKVFENDDEKDRETPSALHQGVTVH